MKSRFAWPTECAAFRRQVEPLSLMGEIGASGRTDEMIIKSMCSLYLTLSRAGGMGWIWSSDSSTQLTFTAMKNCPGANGRCLNSDTKTSVIFLSKVPGSTF